MSNNAPAKQTIKGLFSDEKVKAKFADVLGKKANGFITSVVQVTAQNKMLATADPTSVYMAAMIAATLDLPINPNLGFAYIIPYNESKNTPQGWIKVAVAQFQMGWKGFVQLALRTGQYEKLNAIAIDKAWFVSWNPLTENLILDFNKEATGEIIGYCGYFKLVNGFEKTVYWSKDQIISHAKRYSQAYSSEKGKTPWKEEDQFDGMALKTVVKLMLSKWGIMSVEMQKAAQADQAVIVDAENEEYRYSDNETEDTEHEEMQQKQIVTPEKFEQIKKGVELQTTTADQAIMNFDLSASQVKELQSINQKTK
jgi:recombination protein RecT